MPPQPPIFSDAALRVRLQRSCVEMAAALENATMTATTPIPIPIPSPIAGAAQRMPSKRPIDHRWDQSRGIVFQHPKRVTPSHACGNDRTWSHGNGTTFAPTPVTKRFARREIAAKTTPQASSLPSMHTPYKAEFTSSTREAAELRGKIKQAEDTLQKQETELRKSKADAAVKSDVINKLQKEVDHLRDTLERIKMDHGRQVSQLNRQKEQEVAALNEKSGQKVSELKRQLEQEQATHNRLSAEIERSHAQATASLEAASTKALSEQQKRYESELEHLRAISSAGLAHNELVLEAVRKEGEEKANAVHAELVKTIEKNHETQLREQATNGAQVVELRANNMKLVRNLRAEEEGRRLDRLRLEKDSDNHRRRANDAVKLKEELQKVLDGRQTRALTDRSDYNDYQYLYRDLNDTGYELLNALISETRNALHRESAQWRESLQKFKTAKELRLFHQMSGRYGNIRQGILDFLDSRANQAQAAAKVVGDEASSLRTEIQDLKPESHNSRTLTRLLRFTDEQTHSDGVKVARQLADLEPFKRRRHEEQAEVKRLDEKLQMATLDTQRAEFEAELGLARERLHLIDMNLQYFDQLRWSEMLKANLNLSPTQKRIETHIAELRKRLQEVTNQHTKAVEDVQGQRGKESLRETERKLKRQFDIHVRLIRQRSMYEEELGLTDLAAEKEFDREQSARLREAQTREQRLLEAIVGQRADIAMTRRKRAWSAPAASSLATRSSMSDLGASPGNKSSPIAIRKTPKTLIRKTLSSRGARLLRHYAYSRGTPGAALLGYHGQMLMLNQARDLRTRDPQSDPESVRKIDTQICHIKNKIAFLESSGVHVDPIELANLSSTQIKLNLGTKSLAGLTKLRAKRLAQGGDVTGIDRVIAGAKIRIATLKQEVGTPEQHGKLQSGKANVEDLSSSSGGAVDVTTTHLSGDHDTSPTGSDASKPQAIGVSNADGNAQAASKIKIPKLASLSRRKRLRLVPLHSEPSQQLSISDFKSSLDTGDRSGDALKLRPTVSPHAPYRAWPYHTHRRRFSTSVQVWHRDLRWSTIGQALQPPNIEPVVPTAFDLGHYPPTSNLPSESARPSSTAIKSAAKEAEDIDTILEAPTILDYQIPAKEYRDAVMASPSSGAAFWSHTLYKSSEGSKVQVYYCKTMETAERQLQLFLNEPVLGFDLEWEQYVGSDKDSIKKNISLVQIAAEDKIALIQVALFKGDTIEELMPPSLRTILEDENIAKAGVNVGGDATRIRKCFGINMRGIFELSHMYRIVRTPSQVSFKLVSLAEQVQNVLLLPLLKSDVRVSAWSRSLNHQQTTYAAADAYAGFRLYNKLDNERKAMTPTPPRPAYFETGKPLILGNGQAVERSQVRSRVASKKAVSGEVADECEDDDVFLDALEELPDTYELGSLEAEPVSTEAGKSAPEEVSGAIDTAIYPKLPPLDPPTPTSATKPTLGPVSSQSNPQNLCNPQTTLADNWISSLDPKPSKLGASTLRAYHLWHHQDFSVQEVAKSCREPPLALTTVASYIMQAIKQEDLPYQSERLKDVLQCLPRTVWGAYWNNPPLQLSLWPQQRAYSIHYDNNINNNKNPRHTHRPKIMGKYSDSPLWADITPLPTNEGGPNPLAAIAYSNEYAETMSYLRAVMALDEASPRVLDLTEDLIDMNPAHYTVWLYRAKVLIKVSEAKGDLLGGLKGELEWLNEIALSHQKNYQIWHHRNLLVNKIGEEAVDVKAEQEFVEKMFALDAKNYHVWSYRQWLVKRFGLWTEGELEFCERMLRKDVRNNSAWNHRWYVINGNGGGGVKEDEAIRDREISFAKKAIEKAPQNCSPWNYLRGVVRESGVGLDTLKEFAELYADMDVDVGGVRSSHALDLLADILGEEEGEGGKVKAGKALDLLATRYDPIRKNYWEYRKGLLGLPPTVATVVAA
ncbi:hypothetical protein AC579_8309 [Pseudocercospora musae]|uniref:Protein farnesyltransferase/geranylgeranyltransferase type-1 subunit alpha n=1 Tax=Pseudocercospora musae TaxID=113226 RepID=A0A139I1I2_9PEZI|nr:hypothetical protein AC579_8309 [Pseudocercospora musae]